ncbi:hypothetical protein G7Y89_g14449 [Cudoniella acicularis]|uniref:Amino acid permease/ SLC12A domain-containing protein n=1 Tax=Cudoniella acicularis TaxID=354080 RepID=A0A8H4VTT0_9HELO|nr:hypothetical protein G7Y89_g14449 [Cudoniella acicularis]
MSTYSVDPPVPLIVDHHDGESSKDLEENSSLPERNETIPSSHPVIADHLARKLSARQVQMIAIGGTIGTGLFLGTGKSLATGGPASMLLSYFIVGVIVLLTMLALGEMAAFVPIAGSFCTFAGRYVDDAFGFALTWNYWFNDAVSTAADLVALQLILAYWDTGFPGAYGEIFIILGIVVNAGGNTSHSYIGGKNWHIGDAPFVGGIGGFASVFVTASFAYGGTESIAITAGETKNPTKNLPRVVKNVFWRILLFYILSVLLIGLNVPYNLPGLTSKNSATSPFTLVFQMAGAKAAGSFINAVIMTSVISAGNHALFAGTRLLYSLSVDGHAPKFYWSWGVVGVVAEFGGGFESACLDRYWDHLLAFPGCARTPRENPSASISELDISMGSMGFRNS